MIKRTSPYFSPPDPPPPPTHSNNGAHEEEVLYQAKGNLWAETAAAMGDDEDGEKGTYLLQKLFEDGGELYKVTGLMVTAKG
jgi:hypothetical protein